MQISVPFRVIAHLRSYVVAGHTELYSGFEPYQLDTIQSQGPYDLL